MKEPDQRYIAAWDLSGTLAEQVGGARRDMPEVLQRLSGLGFDHYVVTKYERSIAENILGLSGLRPLITKIISEEDFSGYDKEYQPVVDASGLSDEQVARRMIVIGDQAHDAPSDRPDVVFLYHEKMFRTSAKSTEEMINHLLDRGRGSFIDGFSQIQQSAGSNFVSLPSGIQFRAGFLSPYTRGNPVIANVTVPADYPSINPPAH